MILSLGFTLSFTLGCVGLRVHDSGLRAQGPSGLKAAKHESSWAPSVSQALFGSLSQNHDAGAESHKSKILKSLRLEFLNPRSISRRKEHYRLCVASACLQRPGAVLFCVRCIYEAIGDASYPSPIKGAGFSAMLGSAFKNIRLYSLVLSRDHCRGSYYTKEIHCILPY